MRRSDQGSNGLLQSEAQSSELMAHRFGKEGAELNSKQSQQTWLSVAHSSNPQAHVPLTQEKLSPQSLPQVPQLSGSELVSVLPTQVTASVPSHS